MIASNTDIVMIEKGRTCPASLSYCIKNKRVWLKYIPKNTQDLYNIDNDTSK